jgi:lipid-binding SYLF domain-containing protein
VTGLLTVLSVIGAGALIGVLLVALLLVFKELQSIRAWFQKITVGMRAVEHQTASLDQRGDVLAASMREALEALHAVSGTPTDGPPGQERPWRT